MTMKPLVRLSLLAASALYAIVAGLMLSSSDPDRHEAALVLALAAIGIGVLAAPPGDPGPRP